ncbi:MAG: outer membrane beta-barrel protein [Chitinophagales bacterium]|jgi:hypothetical protein
MNRQKVRLLLVLLLGCWGVSQAQFTDRGRFMLGSAVGFATNSSKIARSDQNVLSEPQNTQWNVAPSIGYFLFDQFVLGIGMDYTSSSEKNEGEETTRDNDLLFGPFARYYVPFGDKAFFLQANFGFGNSTDNLILGGVKQNINTNILAYGAGPGFTIFSNDALGIEALVKYNYARSKFNVDVAGVQTSTTTKTNQIALSLGMQVYFAGLRR